MRHPISNDVLDAGDIAILGRKGTGKTYAAKGLVERLINRSRRVIVIDPIGIWWGLKLAADGQAPGLPVVVIGGHEAHIPIPATDDDTAQKIGKLILETDLSIVLDVADLKRPSNLTFVAAVLRVLYEEHKGSALFLVLEEADVFAPQSPKSAEERAVFAEIEHLARRGRSRGFRLLSVTQRPARLHKDVLTQFDTMAVFALPGRNDRDTIKHWMEGVTDIEIHATLPTLEVGEAWVFTPRTRSLAREKFPLITTYDSSSTPLAGHPRARRGALSEEKLNELREMFASLIGEKSRPRLSLESRKSTIAGDAIRQLRRHLKLSQSELAQKMGSEQKSISRMESGVVAVSTTTLKRIADATNSTLRIEFVPRRKASET